MLDAGMVLECGARVEKVRRRRCGGAVWRAPPTTWYYAVKSAWPSIYRIGPLRCPDGWVDIVLAMSDHVSEKHDAQVFDIFQDIVSGSMSVRYGLEQHGDFEALNKIVDSYERISQTTCCVCGGQGKPRSSGMWKKSIQVLCEEHA